MQEATKHPATAARSAEQSPDSCLCLCLLALAFDSRLKGGISSSPVALLVSGSLVLHNAPMTMLKVTPTCVHRPKRAQVAIAVLIAGVETYSFG